MWTTAFHCETVRYNTETPPRRRDLDHPLTRDPIGHPGILRLDLDKESYERAGLVGKPIRGGGRKHVKARYRNSLLSNP